MLLASRWEYDESYCDAVKKTSPYDSGPRLLDIIDTAVFDYLIGNADRHHYESFQDDEGASMLILLDNAKRWGQQDSPSPLGVWYIQEGCSLGFPEKPAKQTRQRASLLFPLRVFAMGTHPSSLFRAYTPFTPRDLRL